MLFRFLFSIIVFLYFSLTGISQNQTSNWIFANANCATTNGGFNVNSCSPNLNINEGSVVQSNDMGDLLFYTDGITLWDASNTPVPNFNSLVVGGVQDYTPFDMGISIKNPNPLFPDSYFLFTTSSTEQDALLPDGIGLNMFRINAPNGLTVSCNPMVFPIHYSSLECITAVRSCNNGVWVIAHDVVDGSGIGGGQFIAIEITSSGVVMPPVFSLVGPVYSGGFNTSLKANIQGDKIALAGEQGPLRVFDFNRTNGVVSNPVMVPNTGSPMNDPSGIEFSPNGNYLYFSSFGGVFQNFLYVVDMANIGGFTGTPIFATPQSTNSVAGDIQMDENDDLIMAIPQNWPNTNFEVRIFQNLNSGAPTLSNSITFNPNPINSFGLPTFPPYLFGNSNPTICSFEPTCHFLDNVSGVLENERGLEIISISGNSQTIVGNVSASPLNSAGIIGEYDGTNLIPTIVDHADTDEEYVSVVETSQGYVAVGRSIVNNTQIGMVISHFDTNYQLIDSWTYHSNEPSLNFEAIKIVEQNSGQLVLIGNIRDLSSDGKNRIFNTPLTFNATQFLTIYVDSPFSSEYDIKVNDAVVLSSNDIALTGQVRFENGNWDSFSARMDGSSRVLNRFTIFDFAEEEGNDAGNAITTDGENLLITGFRECENGKKDILCFSVDYNQNDILNWATHIAAEPCEDTQEESGNDILYTTADNLYIVGYYDASNETSGILVQLDPEDGHLVSGQNAWKTNHEKSFLDLRDKFEALAETSTGDLTIVGGIRHNNGENDIQLVEVFTGSDNNRGESCCLNEFPVLQEFLITNEDELEFEQLESEIDGENGAVIVVPGLLDELCKPQGPNIPDPGDIIVDQLTDGGSDESENQSINYIINKVNYFPNPTDSKLTVISSIEEIKSFELYSVSGVLLMSHKDIFSTKADIDLSHYEVGLYLIKCELVGGESKISRIVKN